MASSDDARNSVPNIIGKLESTLDLARRQLLEDAPHRETVDFDITTFWNNFIASTKMISHEATKFSMAFDGEGMLSTEACQCLVDKVESSCLSLLAVFVTLPKAKGKLLYKNIHEYVGASLQRMINLCSAIRNRRHSLLQLIGDIWDNCEAVQALPKDNVAAVVALCQEQYGMVDDASQELMETLQNEDPGFELTFVPPPLNGLQVPPIQAWTTSDRNVLLPCSGLVKAAKACIKKTIQAISARGDVMNEGTINELDVIAEIVKDSSLLADDFVLSLYPPMNHSAVREQAFLIRTNSKALLTQVRSSHFCSEGDQTWVDFLEKAVDHNWVRITDMVLAD